MDTRIVSLSALVVVGVALALSSPTLSQNIPGPASDQASTSGKAYLGVQLAPVPELLAMHLPGVLDPDQGVVIVAVNPDSPAARGGLQANDILVGFEGQGVSSYDALIKRLNQSKPDQTVEVKVIRRGKPLSVKIQLGPRPTGFAENQPPAGWPAAPGFPSMPDLDALRGGGNLQDMQETMERMNKMMEQMNEQFRKGFGGTMPPMPNLQPIPNRPLRPRFDPDASSSAQAFSSEFTTIQVNRINGQYKVRVKYKAPDGEVRELHVEGTAEDVRKAAEEDEKMPDDVRQQLLQAVETGILDPPQDNA